MLKLVDIKKDYKVADTVVPALKGVSVSFRKNEFVSILGPSGCGKTTLLNIIGGLDKYTSGDLFINGKSTKEYKDRDWDVYRNHRIGFIFQSYNLIPHQTVLGNVELALTIAGIGKEERVKRAKEALDRVGLKDQYYKHPNQLSGGQCQRVAIARALVNEPEILLADEPTGALDTVTSVQIMELIKEISKSKLVIMVTHNPELAEKYSSRIIRLLDGNLIEDTDPFKEGKSVKVIESEVNEKAKMSLWTAFKLSFRNLKSKFKRTLMVCLASSIGIVGVSSVLSLSTGIKTYISDMQDDMLSGNPLVISQSTIDLNALMATMSDAEKRNAVKKSIVDGYVNVNSVVQYLVEQGETMKNLQVINDINDEYIKYVEGMPAEYYVAISKNYGINLMHSIYTDMNFLQTGSKKTSITAITQIYTSLLQETDFKDYAPMIATLSAPFSQSINNPDYILSQYDIVSNPNTSKIATEYNEIMIVINKDQELNDLLLAQLGYYTQEKFLNLVYEAYETEETPVADRKYNPELDKDRFSYDELLNKTFTWYPNDTIYTASSMLPNVPFTYSPYADELWDSGIDLHVTAILKPKENLNYGSLSSGFYYTDKLVEKILETNASSEIVQYLDDHSLESFSTSDPTSPMTVMYQYQYKLEEGSQTKNGIGAVGSVSTLAALTGNASYNLSKRALGGETLPNSISIYPTNFEQKNNVNAYLDRWNSDDVIVVDGKTLTKADRSEIKYTDTLGLVIDIMNSLIDIITVALVAFTSLSLVVSTVMIGIIIYVSVIERIKEIGVIRSLGGRKKDVSHLFNAESIIIGTSSGLIGVGVTYLLGAIANIIVYNLVEVRRIAILPISYAIIIVLVSVLLTAISGLVPASLAAKKDPVIALRTE
ncbi:MAG: ABC transporter ATP-binding protein/permease [Bacilli bacterium]|nr:ABC transporter ATP-binding protein/permease [Bacilli bacterium]